MYIDIKADSKIMTDVDKESFAKLLDDNNKKNVGLYWKLLFRGSRDGFTWKAFDDNATGIPGVISVILTENGNVFGGYSSVGWPKMYRHDYDRKYDKQVKYTKEKEAFLHIMRNKKFEPTLFPVNININSRDKDKEEYHSFAAQKMGKMGDFFCNFGLNGTNGDSFQSLWSDGPSGSVSFVSPLGAKFDAGNMNFKIIELECYQCRDYEY